MYAPLLQHPVIAPIAAAMLGAIFGSFIGALVVRWPAGRPISTGRSQCDSCGTVLKAWQLIPLVSYIVLRGRCAACGAAIGRSSLLIELAAALIGAVSLALHPGIEGLAIAFLGWLLLPLALLDWQHYWLPHPLTAALALGGLASAALGLPPDWTSRIIGAGAGLGGLSLVALLYRLMRGREGLGGGDPLLLGAIGLWLGWQALPIVLMIASGLGLAAALVMQRRGLAIDSATRFPLGTLLALAAWPVALAGPLA
ncbi:type 4 prepilin peptidase 1 [Blastomonas natatoria]|uniref:Prepilin leader peptidase/N-methyltransferase n=1 Tax=Blastomonas natatoria TaxID=34015 RepID=A0A2V3USG0_9SPHN|nr:A24 family peptidase [Blastomonas natatoria]PXW71258.1 type 4 prepilin peptidase 1 [Blastomonas natatoria]